MSAVVLYSEPYNYLQLNEKASEVRLLTILPGTFDSEVRVVLNIVPFPTDSNLLFEALSYTWGSSESLAKILVGQSGRRTITITRNLAEALPYLRFEHEPRSIWIDAICVNQQDLAERGSQVLRMPDIYRKATRVVVWLGPSSHDCSEAFNLLRSLGSKVKVNWQTLTMEPSTTLQDQNEIHWADVKKMIPFTELQLRAIYSLLYRPWFERLWVRQEVALASKATVMMCGIDSIPWQIFRNGIFAFNLKPSNAKCYYDEPGLMEEWAARRNMVYQVCKSSVQSIPFPMLTAQIQDAKCLDPRDRIYAVLSIFDFGFVVTPDYKKSCFEVYKDITLQSFLRSNYLHILTASEMSEGASSVDKRHSWVPDWSKPRATNPLDYYHSSSLSRAITKVSDCGDSLTVGGVLACVVEDVYHFDVPDVPYGQPPDSATRLKTKLKRIVKQLYKDEQAASDDMLAFCRTICAGQVSQHFHPPYQGYNSLEEATAAFIRFLGLIFRGKEAEWTETDTLFFATLEYCCRGRSIFTTAEKKLGLAPKAVKPGDIVVVLLGCNLPVVLRPASSSKYQVVGEAYCDGMMSGEALLGPLPENFSEVNRHDAQTSRSFWSFLDKDSGELRVEDPRLGELPSGWVRKPHKHRHLWSWFANTETKEEMKGILLRDPRLEPEALRARGVDIQAFELV